MNPVLGRRRASARTSHPGVELLEDRWVPSVSPATANPLYFFDNGAAFAIDNAGNIASGGNFVSAPDFIVAGLQSGTGGQPNSVFVRRYDSGQDLLSTTTAAGSGVLAAPVAAASDAAGDFLVAWLFGGQSDGSLLGGVEAQRFAAPSTPQGTPPPLGSPVLLLAPPPTLPPGAGGGIQPYNVAAAMNAGGAFVLAEESVESISLNGVVTQADQLEVRAYSASGAPASAVIPLSNPQSPTGALEPANPAVAMDDAGDFVVVWNDGGEIVAQRYNLLSGGYVAGAVMPVVADSGEVLGGQPPTVAMDAAGDFVVAWSGGAEFFPAAGSPARVNVPSGYPSQAVGMDAAGDFAFAYIASGAQGYELDVLLYSPSGTLLQTVQALPVATTAFSSPGDLAVATDGAGSFIVSAFLYDVTPEGWYGRLFLTSPGSPSSGSPSPTSPSSPSSPSSSFGSAPSSALSSFPSTSFGPSSAAGLLVSYLEPATATLVAPPVVVPPANGGGLLAPTPAAAVPPEGTVMSAEVLPDLAGGGPDGRVGDISGVVFLDRNGNGIREPGEAGVAGLTVFIDLRGDGQFHPGDPYTVTNAKGEYVFHNLPVDRTYQVREAPARYLEQTYPQKGAAQVVPLSDDHPSKTDVTFGTVPFKPAAPPVRPAGNTSAPRSGAAGGNQSRNDPRAAARDAAFTGEPFWRPAAVSLAMAAALAMRPDRRRRRPDAG